MREFPFTIDLYQFGSTQVSEVSRHDRLREFEYADDIANAKFPGHEQVQNSDTGGICKPAKQQVQISET